MRIIAGTARGRRIEAPRGEHTRPTTDRVRESLMSSIASEKGGFVDLCVCDAFAGSGALALEALSRGSAFAVLCDRDRGALETIAKNVESLGFEAMTRVLSSDVLERGLPQGPAPYDVVFLDPPYATDPAAIARLLKGAKDAGRLAEGCLISYEHDDRATDADMDSVAEAAGLDRLRTRAYGSTTLDYLRA